MLDRGYDWRLAGRFWSSRLRNGHGHRFRCRTGCLEVAHLRWHLTGGRTRRRRRSWFWGWLNNDDRCWLGGWRLRDCGRLFNDWRLDLFSGRQRVNLLFSLEKGRRLDCRRRSRGVGFSTFGDSPFQGVDLVRFKTTQLILDVVAQVPAIFQDGFRLKRQSLGQFKYAKFLDSRCRQALLLLGVSRAQPHLFGGKFFEISNRSCTLLGLYRTGKEFLPGCPVRADLHTRPPNRAEQLRLCNVVSKALKTARGNKFRQISYMRNTC